MRNRLLPILILAVMAAMGSASPALAEGGRPGASPASTTVGPPSASGTAAPSPFIAATATASKTFTFYGAGWGHGVGLSQYGAYGLALKGWKHVSILKHYYTGTTVGSIPAGYPTHLRAGLTWDRGRIHLKAVGGPVRLRVGSPTGTDRYTIPRGYGWTVRATPTGRFRLLNAKGQVVDTVGGQHTNLYAVYEPTGARVQIPEAGHSYSRGYVELNVYRPQCGGTPCPNWYVRAIAVVTPQEYVYGLGEVPSSWPLQAMEAQAVAARSYALAKAAGGQHRSDHGACNCGLYPSTVDQVYAGWDKEAEGAGWVHAVQGTAGQVVRFKGSVIMAVYSSSSGGFSESNEYAWFNPPIPYLRSVCDPGDYTKANPNRVWSMRLTGAQIGYRLSRYGYRVGTVTGFESAVRSPKSGRVVSVVAHGTGGSDGKSVKVVGPVLSGALGLRDDKVWINVNRNVVGGIRTRYDSLMCAPGLAASRRFNATGGVFQRFENGALYLATGHPIAAWSHGAIYNKYVNFGGARSALGFARSDIIPLSGPSGCGSGGCARESFARGRIYLKRGAGAHELHGAVLTYYLAHGGAGGGLGFPTSDVKRVAGGGRKATFEHGIVTCSGLGDCSPS